VFARSIHSETELRVLFENTAKDRLPIANATVLDLDHELIRNVFRERGYENPEAGDVGELANTLGLFAAVPLNNRMFLHQASVICFCRYPEKFVPQATSTLVIGDIANSKFVRKEFRGALSLQVEELYRETISNLSKVATVGEGGGGSRQQRYHQSWCERFFRMPLYIETTGVLAE